MRNQIVETEQKRWKELNDESTSHKERMVRLEKDLKAIW